MHKYHHVKLSSFKRLTIADARNTVTPDTHCCYIQHTRIARFHEVGEAKLVKDLRARLLAFVKHGRVTSATRGCGGEQDNVASISTHTSARRCQGKIAYR